MANGILMYECGENEAEELGGKWEGGGLIETWVFSMEGDINDYLGQAFAFS